MSKVKDQNFVAVHGWMITKLGLSGNDLMCYAIIYGFSQDDESIFSGSLQYLADWCNSTKRGIQKNLNNLLKKGLIKKEEYHENNVKYCNYYAVSLEGGIEQSSIGVWNKVPQGIEQSSTYNIDDKKDKKKDNISKDILSEQPDTDTDDNTVKPKRKNRYEQFIDIIEKYTDDEKLRELLTEYAKLCLEIKRDLYANQFKGKLRTLDAESKGDLSVKYKLVEKSLDRGWLSFYANSLDNNYNVSSNGYKQSSKPNAGLQMQEPDAKSFSSREEADAFTENLKKENEKRGRRAVF